MRVFLVLCSLLAPAVHAATCSAVSGESRNRLLELYTSEGCSSCPPADRWLTQLPPDSRVIPLAFHVDYWDRLGWKDPFAQAAFSQRQRARNSGMGWVYTPQVMLDGEDFRAWQRGLPAPAGGRARLTLDLVLVSEPRQLDVTVTPHFVDTTANRDARLYLALTENHLVSKVAAGENAERILRHDHVVRELAGPFSPHKTRYRFKLVQDWEPGDLAITAFVLDAEGKTLQAVVGECT